MRESSSQTGERQQHLRQLLAVAWLLYAADLAAAATGETGLRDIAASVMSLWMSFGAQDADGDIRRDPERSAV
jgi:hypothetical protein